MHQHVGQSCAEDSLDPFNLLQLADDTLILADSLDSFKSKMILALEYSDKKLLKINSKKTKFIHLSDNPMLEYIPINASYDIEPVNDSDGYSWLGIYLRNTNDVTQTLQFNFNKKKYIICKFYAWLEINETAPIKIKMQVLYNCMFSAILYSCETWGEINHNLLEEICLIERKALKSIMGVKSGTSNDIVYAELGLPEFPATIKDRQYKLFAKVLNLQLQDASLKGIIERYTSNISQLYPHNTISYYTNLQDDNVKKDVYERVDRINRSSNTMCMRYVALTGMKEAAILYKSTHYDTDRGIITRWRLSSHSLHIETGQYKRPKTERCDRKCIVCEVVEDEEHAIFHCSAHLNIRRRHRKIITKYDSIQKILNPSNVDDMKEIASVLRAIEKNMVDLKLIQ